MRIKTVWAFTIILLLFSSLCFSADVIPFKITGRDMMSFSIVVDHSASPNQMAVLADQLVLKALSENVFNDVLWPDFTAIPNRKNPIVRLQAMKPFEYTRVDSLRIEAIPVQHRVHTTGFLVKEGDKTIMLTSDTGMTEQFWETARAEEHVEFIVAHVAFPNRLSHLASTAGHMTLSVLLDRIDTYRLHHIPFYIAHMKSMFEEEVRGEMREAGRQNIRVLEQDSVLFA